MNQILNSQVPKQPEVNKEEQLNAQKEKIQKAIETKKSQKKPLSEKAIQAIGIIRYFAIFLLIYGVLNIAFGSYSLAKNVEELKEFSEMPSIELEDIDVNDSYITVNINSKTSIDTITYQWDDGDPKTVPANNITSRTETINNVPDGTHTLKITVENTAGKTQTLEKVITRDADTKIEYVQNDPYITVRVKAKNGLQYITYNWNDETAKRVELDEMEEDEDGYYTYDIKAINGNNTLIVNAVDNNNMQENYEQVVVSSNEVEDTGNGPEVKLEASNTKFYVTIESETGLRLVQYILYNEVDGEKKYQDKRDGNDKEYEISFNLYSGENTLKVIAYDVDNEVTIQEISKTIN